MRYTAAYMNSILVEMWKLFQQQSASVIIDALNKRNLLPLVPPDHDTNTQRCLAATQMPPGMKSEETKDIDRAYMAPGEVESIKTTYQMVILRANGVSSRNLLIRATAYDTVQKRKIIPIKEMKEDEMEMRKRSMVSMSNRHGEK